MGRRWYLDTNIWLDLYEQRGRASKVAILFFNKIIRADEMIYYSDATIIELKQVGYGHKEIMHMFSIAKPKHLKKVHINKQQIDEARKIARKHNVPQADALHAILARDNQLTLVTRDQQDFPKLKHICAAILPKDVI